ncbi:MAG: serine hydrolase domain-containing protein [Flavobacteriaceae bacterium]
MTKQQIKNILKIGFIIASIASLAFVPWSIVKAWIMPLPSSVQEQLNETISQGSKGVIVYIDKKGAKPELHTAGWHDEMNKIPAKPDALFKIASVSKLYVAVAIAKLVQSNRLSLEGTVAYYFPELKGKIPNTEQITLKMLVQHRSGIPNYTDTENYWAAPKATNQENLELIFGLPASFAPDESYEYSNTNYLLLRELMTRTLGHDYFKFIQSNILKPLGLQNTYQSIKDVNIDHVMSGYHIGHPLDLKTDDIGMVASVEDVGKFIRALNDGTIFNDGEQDLYSSIYKYEHSGWVPGYQSFAIYDEELDAVIVQFTSTTDAKLHLWHLSEISINRIVKVLKNKNNS